MKKLFSEEQEDFLRQNYDKMSYSKIAEILGFTERQVRGRINNMGLSKIRKFDKHYFDNIDNPIKAYWLGFIYADGYIIYRPEYRTYELGIELNQNDDYLLEQLSQVLGDAHPIKYKHNQKDFNNYQYETDSCVLRIYSKDICSALIDKNVLPNKTNRIEYPVCGEYKADFIRGFLDGDGCIYIDAKGHININFTNSNKLFLIYLNTIVKDLCGVEGRIYQESDKKYRLVFFRQNEIRILLDNIYYDNMPIYLERKYQIYKSYYGFAA